MVKIKPLKCEATVGHFFVDVQICRLRVVSMETNGYSYGVQFGINCTAEVIIEGEQIFKMAASRFVDVSEEEINLMKENAIPRNTKHATKFGMTLFKGKM